MPVGWINVPWLFAVPFSKPLLQNLDVTNSHSRTRHTGIIEIADVAGGIGAIIKSFTYFKDAEQYADPNVFDKTVTWTKVKNKILEVVQQLA